MDVWLRVLQGFRAWDKGVRGYQKAIQQDFHFQVESKEVNQNFRVAMEYLGVIFKDYQDMMEGSGLKDTWANMESLMAIYEDLWDRIVSKGVSLRMGFKRLGTQTSLREGYQEAIHQDFLYQVESKEVGFGFRQRAINRGILLKYLFVIHQ